MGGGRRETVALFTSMVGRNEQRGTGEMTKNEDDRTRGLNLRDIPGLAAMVRVPRWCLWYWRAVERKDGRRGRTKVPVIPGTGRNVRVNDLEGVVGYDAAAAAVEAAEGAAAGLAGAWLGVSGWRRWTSTIAAILGRGKIDGWALAILTAAPGAYREVTPSGTGLRLIGRLGASGGVPEAFQGRLRVGEWVKGLEGPDNAVERAWWGVGIKAGAAVEIFHACARFITVTGWDGTGDCETDISAVVEWLMERADERKTIEGKAERERGRWLLVAGAHRGRDSRHWARSPNDDLGWDDWSATGMAIWGATGGSEDGYAGAQGVEREERQARRWGVVANGGITGCARRPIGLVSGRCFTRPTKPIRSG